jgi:hypothetical protein
MTGWFKKAGDAKVIVKASVRAVCHLCISLLVVSSELPVKDK